MEPDEERGLVVYLGAEFYPPARRPLPEPPPSRMEEEDEPQPFVEGQPTIFEPNPAAAASKAGEEAARASRQEGRERGQYHPPPAPEKDRLTASHPERCIDHLRTAPPTTSNQIVPLP